MAFAAPTFAKSFASLRPVPAESAGDRFANPDAGALYLVGGGDGWLRRRTLRRIGEHHLGAEPAPYRLRRFDGQSARVDQVLSAARTVSFSGGPVVLIENGLRVTQPPRKAAGLADALLGLVESPPPRAVIALEWERNPDQRRKDWKKLASALADALAGKRALVLDCDAPPDGRMVHWIRRAARERDLHLPEQGAELLHERFGRDLRRHVNEIEKLVLYVGDDQAGEVTLPDMEQVLGGGSVRDRFRFTDAVLAGRPERALATLDQLLRDGEAPADADGPALPAGGADAVGPGPPGPR